MTPKSIVKPGKLSLKVGLIVTGLFFLFGIFFMYLISGESDSYIGLGFLTFWEIVVGILFVTFAIQLKNYDRKKNDNSDFWEIENPFNSENNPISFDEKLRKLEQLKKDHLISETEFYQKREEILKEKW